MPRWLFWVIIVTVAGLVLAPVDTAHIYHSIITGVSQFITGLGLH